MVDIGLWGYAVQGLQVVMLSFFWVKGDDVEGFKPCSGMVAMAGGLVILGSVWGG